MKKIKYQTANSAHINSCSQRNLGRIRESLCFSHLLFILLSQSSNFILHPYDSQALVRKKSALSFSLLCRFDNRSNTSSTLCSLYIRFSMAHSLLRWCIWSVTLAFPEEQDDYLFASCIWRTMVNMWWTAKYLVDRWFSDSRIGRQTNSKTTRVIQTEDCRTQSTAPSVTASPRLNANGPNNPLFPCTQNKLLLGRASNRS